MGWGSILSQLSGGPKFRKHRKITQETMGPRYMNEYIPLQKKTTHTFLADVGDTPANFVEHIKRWDSREHELAQSSHLTPYIGFVRPFYRESCYSLTYTPQPLPRSWVSHMDIPLMTSTTSSFNLPTRQHSRRFATEDRDPLFVT